MPVLVKKSLKRQSLQLVLSSCLLWLQPSCGSWSGNPPAHQVVADPEAAEGSVNLSIQGSGSFLHLVASSLNVKNKDGSVYGTLELTSARIALAEIKLRVDNQDSLERRKLKGPFIVDLLSNAIAPSLDSLKIPSGQYKDISLKIHKVGRGDADETDSLMDQSLVIEGILTHNGEKQEIRIGLEIAQDISLMKQNQSKSIVVQADAATEVIVAFNMDHWFDFSGRSIDLGDFVSVPITIEDKKSGKNGGNNQQQKLREALEHNIKASMRFGDDKDRDGKLGKNEDNDDGNDQ